MSSATSLQQDCGLAHHFQVHRSDSGQVSGWNGKTSSQPRIYTAWCSMREVLLKIQSYESHERQLSHPHSVLDPHSGRSMGGGKIFLPREKEKLDSGGRCWLEGGLALPFSLSLSAQQNLLTLAISQNRTFFFWQSYPTQGPSGQSRLPGGTILNSGGGSLSQACTFFWSVLSGY